MPLLMTCDPDAHIVQPHADGRKTGGGVVKVHTVSAIVHVDLPSLAVGDEQGRTHSEG
jgi:hypothetical protein